MRHHSLRLLLAAGSTVAVVLAALATSLTVAAPASATEAFTKQTGKPCGACHEAPAGGGKLTPYGEKFKANGNKVPSASD